MTEENTYKNIHRYLLGEMEGVEADTFKQELEQNETLRNKFEMEQKLINTLDLSGDAELRDTISTVHNKLKGESFFENTSTKKEAKIVAMNSRRNNKWLYAIAASVALLAAAWWVFNNRTTTEVDTNSLYANYYKTEKNITNDLLINIGQDGGGGQLTTREENLRYALDQFSHGAFENAEKYFSELNVEFPNDPLIVFYNGLCQMELENYDSAINFLNKAVENNTDYTDAAQWYLGLSYLKNNQINEAIGLFEKIANDNSSVFQKNAKEILKEFD